MTIKRTCHIIDDRTNQVVSSYDINVEPSDSFLKIYGKHWTKLSEWLIDNGLTLEDRHYYSCKCVAEISISRIIHCCDECGDEISGDYCEAHPNATISSVIIP